MSDTLFGIKPGMRDLELLDELEIKVGLHGENRQELQTLVKDVKREINHEAYLKSDWPCLDVVSSNDNYALLVQYDYTYADNIKKTFWLTGINDEENYFLKRMPLDPLQSEDDESTPHIGKYIPKHLLRDLDALVEHVNRVDQGFQRVQGDILIKFEPICLNTIVNDGTVRQFKIPYNRAADGEESHLRFLTSQQVEHEAPRALDFGGHWVYTDGRLYAADAFMLEPLVVDGKRLVLQHPEHGKKVVDIPKGHYAVLGAQRGQNGIQGRGRHTANLD